MIRPATPSDAAGIARVHVETFRAAYAGLVAPEFLAALSVPAAAARWDGHLADPAARVWVATGDGGEVAGFASAGPSRDADLPAAGEVYALYVRPAAQRTGRGGRLLAAAAGWLAGTGRPVAFLWVLTANAPGRAFYAARGWAPDGAAREMDIGGAVVDEVRYRRNLGDTHALT